MRHMMSDFTIAVAPQIADSDQGVIELSVLIGRDVTLYCRVTAGAPTPSIEWMHDNGTIEWTPEGAVLKEGGVASLLPPELQSLRLEERGQVLRLDGAMLLDDGAWSCRASNPAGTASKEFLLNVLSLSTVIQ